MRSVKHLGFGRYVVLEDGAPVGDPFTGNGAKERAHELARNPPPKPSVRSALEGDRAYWAKVNADLGKPLAEEEAELKAILAKRRDEDEVKIILEQLRPILKAGKQARRRGRRMHVLPKVA